MYQTSADNRSSWQLDAKWVSGVLLVIALAVTMLFFSLARISRPEPAQDALTAALESELFPQGMDGAEPLVALDAGLDYQPGEPFRLTPGIDVSVPSAELEGLTAETARMRVARELTDSIITGGLDAALARVSDAQLSSQLSGESRATLLAILNAHLGRAMLPSGLADGSRLANWPLQAQRNPGELVQPVVGVFLRFDPATLRPLSESQIGLLVIERLAEITLTQGLAAAEELVVNSNLLFRLRDATQNEARAAFETYLSTLLAPREAEIERRLAEAREIISAQAEGVNPEDEVLAGLTSRQDLEGLTPEQANARVLSDLASVVYAQGVPDALELIPDENLRERVQSAAEPQRLYTEAEHSRFVRLTWLFGLLALLFLVLLLVFGSGLGRLLSAGLALMAAPLVGLLVFTPLWRSSQVFSGAAPPERFSLSGVFGFLGSSLTYPPGGAEAGVVQAHLLVMVVGAGLIVLLLLLKFVGLFRGRRRRF